jgi:hypothetical protein
MSYAVANCHNIPLLFVLPVNTQVLNVFKANLCGGEKDKFQDNASI